MTLIHLIKRNMQLYFKDKGMVMVSLITPIILLVLYITFLGKVFRDSFIMSVPEGIPFDEKLVNGLVAGQLISSILAACTVTISFCTNIVMIQDKYTHTIKDLTIAPVKKSTLALSYFIASLLATLMVCYITMGLGFIYMAIEGWYITIGDVFLIMLDVLLLAIFGTALSSIAHFFLNTQGQASAVGTIVSSLYGFICGAYMPMSQFPDGLRKTLSFLPGTYGTVLLRNHTMAHTIEATNFPPEVIEGMRNTVDCNIEFFGNSVGIPTMYAILGGTCVALVCIYILLNYLKRKAK